MRISDLIRKRRAPEILRALEEKPSHVRDLRERVGGSQSTIQTRIREMLEEGLITRRKQDNFPFKKITELTERGRDVVRALNDFEGVEQRRKIETIAFDREKSKLRWPLVILREQGALGATKIQKLVFLAKREFGIEIPYDFVPYKHGPFSKELARDMGRLMTLKFVDPKETEYDLSEEGEEVAGDLCRELDGETRRAVRGLEKYSKLSLRQLLNYVYRQYPEESGGASTNLRDLS